MFQYQAIPVTSFRQNCSPLWCDQTLNAAVVDPGGDLDPIKAEVKRRGVKLTQILLTHAHIDHAGGTGTLAVRHCPGHTPGHVVFHNAQAQRSFVGDVLIAGSIGRTDFPGGGHATLINSITQRLWPMGDATVFIPGHGPESSFDRERRSNPFVAGT